MNKINVEDINKRIIRNKSIRDIGMTVPDEHGEGVVLLKTYSKGMTSGGSPKCSGVLVNKVELRFNAWEASKAFEYLNALNGPIAPKVVHIKYSITKYGLVVNDIEDSSEYSANEFIEHKYDAAEQEVAFENALRESNATDKAINVVKTVLHYGTGDVINDRFVQEYAASSHHDNCATGLLAHTVKCLKIYNGIKDAYPYFADEKTNDLMVIGLALHDVGKIFEMRDGVYQPNSHVTHRGLGVEHLLKYKDAIVEQYSEAFFYGLYGIILQHHGEYGEHPKSIYADAVHLIDELEAKLTTRNDLVTGNIAIEDASGSKIRISETAPNDTYLMVLPENKEEGASV